MGREWDPNAWQQSPEHDKAPPAESDPVIQQETRGHEEDGDS